MINDWLPPAWLLACMMRFFKVFPNTGTLTMENRARIARIIEILSKATRDKKNSSIHLSMGKDHQEFVKYMMLLQKKGLISDVSEISNVSDNDVKISIPSSLPSNKAQILLQEMKEELLEWVDDESTKKDVNLLISECFASYFYNFYVHDLLIKQLTEECKNKLTIGQLTVYTDFYWGLILMAVGAVELPNGKTAMTTNNVRVDDDGNVYFTITVKEKDYSCKQIKKISNNLHNKYNMDSVVEKLASTIHLMIPVEQFLPGTKFVEDLKKLLKQEAEKEKSQVFFFFNEQYEKIKEIAPVICTVWYIETINKIAGDITGIHNKKVDENACIGGRFKVGPGLNKWEKSLPVGGYVDIKQHIEMNKSNTSYHLSLSTGFEVKNLLSVYNSFKKGDDEERKEIIKSFYLSALYDINLELFYQSLATELSALNIDLFAFSYSPYSVPENKRFIVIGVKYIDSWGSSYWKGVVYITEHVKITLDEKTGKATINANLPAIIKAIYKVAPSNRSCSQQTTKVDELNTNKEISNTIYFNIVIDNELIKMPPAPSTEEKASEPNSKKDQKIPDITYFSSVDDNKPPMPSAPPTETINNEDDGMLPQIVEKEISPAGKISSAGKISFVEKMAENNNDGLEKYNLKK